MNVSPRRSRYHNPDGTMSVHQAMLLKHADELDYDEVEDITDYRDEEAEIPQEPTYFGDEVMVDD